MLQSILQKHARAGGSRRIPEEMENQESSSNRGGNNASTSIMALCQLKKWSGVAVPAQAVARRNIHPRRDLQKTPSKRDMSISVNKRCIPYQDLKAQKEQNRLKEAHRVAHQQALEQLLHPSNTFSAEVIAREASKTFNIQVLGNDV